jgi:sugar phosphate isomerase/epimerase
MKLCVTNISFNKISFQKFLRLTKQIGIKNVELAPDLICKNPYNLKKTDYIKKNLKQNQIKVLSLQSLFFKCKKLDFENKNHKVYLIQYFEKIIKFAKSLSISKISIGSCPTRKVMISKKKLFELNFYFFKIFSTIAKKNNILLCLEPIKKKYGIHYLNSPKEVLDFIIKTKIKNLKLLLDSGNLKGENDFQKKFMKYRKNIGHIQLSNKDLNKIDINSIKKSITFLKSKNYKNTVTIEFLSKKGKKIKELTRLVNNI